jgi:hypothetical protein
MNVTMADFWGGAFSGVKSECHGGAHYSYVHELVRMTLPNLKPYNLVSRTCRVVAASLKNPGTQKTKPEEDFLRSEIKFLKTYL